MNDFLDTYKTPALVISEHAKEEIGKILYTWAREQDVWKYVCETQHNGELYTAPEFR